MKLSPLIPLVVLTLMARTAFASRTLEHQATIDAPIAEVWSAWTTNEGFTSWAVAKAEIDLRIGGEMRTSYNPQSTLDDEHTIINRIISFEPQRMLSIQNVKAPAGFKNAELFQNTWSVIYFDPIVPDRTHLRIVGMGYGEGAEWDDLYSKFKAGNQWTLDKLREKFAPAASAAAAADGAEEVLAVLASMVGGHWVHENTRPDGNVFRARVLMELGPDGKSVLSSGWLGDGQGMFAHAATQIWREPPSAIGAAPASMRFQTINENGAVARGEIHLAAPKQIEWDWLATELDGKSVRYRVTMKVEDADHYRFTLRLPRQTGVEEDRQLIDFVYTRVYELPAAFTRMKPAH
jgi:uncharacterized protein YndB with AHSA1/START domain